MLIFCGILLLNIKVCLIMDGGGGPDSSPSTCPRCVQRPSTSDVLISHSAAPLSLFVSASAVAGTWRCQHPDPQPTPDQLVSSGPSHFGLIIVEARRGLESLWCFRLINARQGQESVSFHTACSSLGHMITHDN